MRWSDLSSEQKVLLTAWYALAGAAPPTTMERLPVEFLAPLGALVSASGATRYRFKRREVNLPRRKPRVRRENYKLAT